MLYQTTTLAFLLSTLALSALAAPVPARGQAGTLSLKRTVELDHPHRFIARQDIASDSSVPSATKTKAKKPHKTKSAAEDDGQCERESKTKTKRPKKTASQYPRPPALLPSTLR